MRAGFWSETMEDIIKILKEIIDQEGPRYISREPYRVYERLIAKKVEAYMEDYDCGYALEKLCAETGLEVNGYSCDGETSDWMLEGRW